MTSSPYDLARRVHLIKSPALSVPPPVTLPTDMHPLPPDLHAYFVYPFSLEAFVLDPNNPNSRTIQELQQRHATFLEWRKEQKEQQERERLRKVAPGWDSSAAPLQPNRKSLMMSSPSKDAALLAELAEGGDASASSPAAGGGGQFDAMQELVDHLSKLDAAAEERQRGQADYGQGHQ